MDFVQLFTSMEGRIPRSRFWIAVLIFIVAGFILSFVIGLILGVGMMADVSAMTKDGTLDADMMMQAMQRQSWMSLLLFIIFIWPAAAIMVKRRHDRGGSGMDVWIFYAVEGIAILVQILGLGYSVQDINGVQIPMPSMILVVLGAVAAIYSIYLLVVCGFLKGDGGANAYGPDPLGEV